MVRFRWPACYSIESCLEVETICLALHSRNVAHSALGHLHGIPGILQLLAGFLLHPPECMEDRFFTRMSGRGVLLSFSLKSASGLSGAVRESRFDMVTAGTKAVDSGLVRWKIRCSGHSWAIGIIADSKWLELLAEGHCQDWPFVGGGFGHGVGLVNRRRDLFVSRRTYGGPMADCRLSSTATKGEGVFGIVLDMGRARVYFEADGAEIPGSRVELVDVQDQYRLIASLPDADSAVTLIP